MRSGETLADHPVETEGDGGVAGSLALLWRMPDGDHAYGTRWRLIKARFSMALAEGERRSASRLRRGRAWHLATPVLGAFDPREDDYARHVDYIHRNPVKLTGTRRDPRIGRIRRSRDG